MKIHKPILDREYPEESKRSLVLQHCDGCLQKLPKACSSRGVEEHHCEGLIRFWLLIQHSRNPKCLNIFTFV